MGPWGPPLLYDPQYNREYCCTCPDQTLRVECNSGSYNLQHLLLVWLLDFRAEWKYFLRVQGVRTIINKLYRVSQYISCGMVCFNTLISQDLDYYYLYSFSTLCLILKVNILKKYILMLFPRILRLCVCGGPCAVFSYYKLSDSPGYTIMRTKHYRAGCRAQSWRGREDGLLIFFSKWWMMLWKNIVFIVYHLQETFPLLVVTTTRVSLYVF